MFDPIGDVKINPYDWSKFKVPIKDSNIEYYDVNFPIEPSEQEPIYYPEGTLFDFDTDKLNLELDLDRDALEVYIFKTNADEFDKYLAKNFTSYDGFISFIANNVHDFRNQYLTEGKCGRALDIMLDFYLLSHLDLDELSYKFSDIAADTIQNFITQV